MDFIRILQLILLLVPIILKWIKEADSDEERAKREATAQAMFKTMAGAIGLA